MPPAPMGETTSYGPSRVPAVSGIAKPCLLYTHVTTIIAQEPRQVSARLAAMWRRLVRFGVMLACLVVGMGAQSRSPASAPFFFLQMSDPQFGMFTSDKDFAQETVNFEMAIATANRLKPAFVLVTGDLVNKAGDAAQIAEYRRIAGRLDSSIRLYQVAGNHDVENAPTPESVAAYTKLFGPDHYTFSHQGLVGIVLNSTLIHTPNKVPDLLAAQDRWL